MLHAALLGHFSEVDLLLVSYTCARRWATAYLAAVGVLDADEEEQFSRDGSHDDFAELAVIDGEVFLKLNVERSRLKRLCRWKGGGGWRSWLSAMEAWRIPSQKAVQRPSHMLESITRSLDAL